MDVRTINEDRLREMVDDLYVVNRQIQLGNIESWRHVDFLLVQDGDMISISMRQWAISPRNSMRLCLKQSTTTFTTLTSQTPQITT